MPTTRRRSHKRKLGMHMVDFVKVVAMHMRGPKKQQRLSQMVKCVVPKKQQRLSQVNEVNRPKRRKTRVNHDFYEVGLFCLFCSSSSPPFYVLHFNMRTSAAVLFLASLALGAHALTCTKGYSVTGKGGWVSGTGGSEDCTKATHDGSHCMVYSQTKASSNGGKPVYGKGCATKIVAAEGGKPAGAILTTGCKKCADGKCTTVKYATTDEFSGDNAKAVKAKTDSYTASCYTSSELPACALTATTGSYLWLGV
jgi:hypothetical protein